DILTIHRRTSAGIGRCISIVRDIPTVVCLDITTDLQTDVRTRNVIEALAIERADPHVFDRLGLDGKIGSMRPGKRDKSCCGAEKKTLCYLHSNLRVPSCSLEAPCPARRGATPNWNAP